MKTILYYHFRSRPLTLLFVIIGSILFSLDTNFTNLGIMFLLIIIYQLNQYIYKDVIKTKYGDIDGDLQYFKKLLPISKKDIVLYYYIIFLIYMAITSIIYFTLTNIMSVKSEDHMFMMINAYLMATVFNSIGDVYGIYIYNKKSNIYYIILYVLYAIYLLIFIFNLNNFYSTIINVIIYILYFIYYVFLKPERSGGKYYEKFNWDKRSFH